MNRPPRQDAFGNNNLCAAVVEVTNRCNLRCPHCASDSGRARADEMTFAEFRTLFSDLHTLGCRDLSMLGGEFLLRSDWYEIACAAKSAGLALQLITNGLLVTPEIRSLFKKLDPQTVGVSLDGATPESYRAARGIDGFETCRSLLFALRDDGFRQVNAITTFTAKNIGDFDRFVELFLDTGIVWQVQMAHKGGERFPDDLLLSRDQFERLADRITQCVYELNDRLRLLTMDDFGYFPLTPKLRVLCQSWDGCPAGRRIVGIRANGDVLPCLSLGSAFVEDNIRRRPLIEIWRDPSSFRRFRGKSGNLTGPCAKCPMARRCKAGCSAMAMSQTGTLTETTFCVRQIETERILKAVAE